MPVNKELLILQAAADAEVINLEKAEAYIDSQLRQRFSADRPNARVHINYTDLARRAHCSLSRAAIELILVRYRAQGWTAEYEIGREDNWLIFS